MPISLKVSVFVRLNSTQFYATLQLVNFFSSSSNQYSNKRNSNETKDQMRSICKEYR